MGYVSFAIKFIMWRENITCYATDYDKLKYDERIAIYGASIHVCVNFENI